jgi:hypothetical protein
MATVQQRGLDELLEDFDALPHRVDSGARKRVERGAVNIKKAWKARWTGHDHIPHLPNAISYDIAETGGTFSAEVGPDKQKRQGPLGNIIEFGTLNNAPIPGGAPALDEEEPRFVETMQDLAETALDRAAR